MTDIENRPYAYIKHQLPGRVRLKIPNKRGDIGYFERIAELFAGYPGITQLQLNAPVASILICHSTEADFSTIAEFAQTNGLFTIIEQQLEKTFSVPHLPLAKLASTGINRLDESLMGFSKGRLDGRSLLVLALFGLAVRQMSQGHILGASSSLLWYAFRLMKEENDKTFDLDDYADSGS